MLISFLLYFVKALFTILSWAIIGQALLSWFHIRPGNPFYPLSVILYQITEPILGPLRRIIPPFGPLDISPVVALVLLQVIEGLLTDRLASVLLRPGGF